MTESRKSASPRASTIPEDQVDDIDLPFPDEGPGTQMVASVSSASILSITSEMSVAEKDKLPLASHLAKAAKTGASNFLLAYNIRAGIALLSRIVQLIQKRKFRDLVDLNSLLSEKHLNFRVEAVSMGLFIGCFTGGYEALQAILLLPPWPLHHHPDLILLRRRSLALYTFVRALQSVYNIAKARNICSEQVMYCFILRPEILPKEYFSFIHRAGPVAVRVLQFTQRILRGATVEPSDVIRFLDDKASPVVYTITHNHPEGMLGGFRSTAFLGTFVALYQATVCVQKALFRTDSKATYFVAGLVASTSILLEAKSRRSEYFNENRTDFSAQPTLEFFETSKSPMVVTTVAQDAPVSLSGLFAASSDSEVDEFENEFEIQNISIGDDMYRIRVFSFHEANANKVWPGMFNLANFMDSHARYSSGRIMELGAATGALAIHLRSAPRNYDVTTRYGRSNVHSTRSSRHCSDICDDGAVAANIAFNSALNALVETLLEIFESNEAEEFLMSWRRRIADSAIFFELMKAAGFRVHHHGSCVYSFFKPDVLSPYLQSLLVLPPDVFK
ncbi:hypothetical protein DYB32_000901 [Aphanomyces invadans]|uniref:Uncharacterized protein n=1 Tax=Aphanomyces invadans TaxID=157072 RepID=A0A3R6VT91_9STRA|nr:hypothetical protein DYB32_000901 [Aphanomyces invadans]